MTQWPLRGFSPGFFSPLSPNCSSRPPLGACKAPNFDKLLRHGKWQMENGKRKKEHLPSAIYHLPCRKRFVDRHAVIVRGEGARAAVCGAAAERRHHGLLPRRTN